MASTALGTKSINNIMTGPAADFVAIIGTEESVVAGGAHAQVARPIGALYGGRQSHPANEQHR